MIKLIIAKVEGYNYFLKDSQNSIHKLNIEFYDIENKIGIGDYLYINEELLKEKDALFCFGPMHSNYGRKIKNSDDKDLLILVIDNEKIYLKRYYG